MEQQILARLRSQRPLIHAITNNVTINDCANLLLACGAAPTMATAPEEMEEMTPACSGLVLNMGNLTTGVLLSMKKAGAAASALGQPIVLDPVGVGATSFRRNAAAELLEIARPTVIRGNISEMKALAGAATHGRGVDAGEPDAVTEESLPQAILFLQALSDQTGAVIAATGAIDLVCFRGRTAVLRGGDPMMAQITGSGCMLTAITAAFCAAAADPWEGTVLAVAAMDLCGELAAKKARSRGEGTGSFRTYLIDAMSLLTDPQLQGGMNLEIR